MQSADIRNPDLKGCPRTSAEVCALRVLLEFYVHSNYRWYCVGKRKGSKQRNWKVYNEFLQKYRTFEGRFAIGFAERPPTVVETAQRQLVYASVSAYPAGCRSGRQQEVAESTTDGEKIFRACKF